MPATPLILITYLRIQHMVALHPFERFKQTLIDTYSHTALALYKLGADTYSLPMHLCY